MDNNEKILKLESLKLALNEIDSIIKTLNEKEYDKKKINEFNTKRWQIWNEIYHLEKK